MLLWRSNCSHDWYRRLQCSAAFSVLPDRRIEKLQCHAEKRLRFKSQSPVSLRARPGYPSFRPTHRAGTRFDPGSAVQSCEGLVPPGLILTVSLDLGPSSRALPCRANWNSKTSGGPRAGLDAGPLICVTGFVGDPNDSARPKKKETTLRPPLVARRNRLV